MRVEKVEVKQFSGMQGTRGRGKDNMKKGSSVG